MGEITGRGIGVDHAETRIFRNLGGSFTWDLRRCCTERFDLSEREADVVVYLAAGWTNPEIAAELWLSPRTVARHVTRICDKVGSRTRAGVVGSVLVPALLNEDSRTRDRELESAA